MSLVAYYKQNTGFTDSSDSGYDGTNNGASIDTSNQHVGAGCGSYNGTNSKITFSSFFNPTGYTKLSIDGYIKNDVGLGNEGIFGWWTGSRGFFIQSTSDGLLVLAGNGGDNGSVVYDIVSDYVYYSMEYDGTLSGNANRLKLYLDNVQQSITFGGAAVIPSQLGTIGNKPEMGNIPTLSRYWDGFIDDQAVYNDTLTSAFRTQRHNGGAGQEMPFVSAGGFPFFFDGGHY